MTQTTVLNIKKGESYTHKYYGRVKVNSIEKDEQQKTVLSYMVLFTDCYGISDSESILSFKEKT